jgi:hypothetical protein
LSLPISTGLIDFGKEPLFQFRNIWADNLNFHRAFGISKEIGFKKRLYILYKIIASWSFSLRSIFANNGK